ncbi:hypothetical protein CPU12_10945 [Malaciobacter molluscorum LMG 25693]|uniref:Uncharacterized protein n=1 Tax=Malaciobacter molluscorum LMG 25693 TaxID=870501 RepID=A0A2G1DFS2_9BACT|nr:hypothetical protein [Malaciobacter molluscorum]AXX93616.1 hypothetical protein AMOL_2678 [Malaciobacter molluscorum LMG 25693]PHO17323.1 hypothetical protein CPU12_10945 [Malaciobacter molluscorum LMG 25693]
MNYRDFLNYLKENNLTVRQIEKELGYSPKSIQNNWKKNDNVPEKALSNLHKFLKLKKQNLEINNLLNNNINNVQLPSHIYKIAKEKSLKSGITIEEYISSLIISKI